jgi:DNA replication protein DnaC
LAKRKATTSHTQSITSSALDESVEEIAQRCIEKSKENKSNGLLLYTNKIEEPQPKKAALAYCGVSPKYLQCRFDNFSGGGKIVDVLSQLTKTDDSIVLTGQTGCGKTHLAVALLAEYPCVDATDPVFVTVPELLLKIRTCFGPKATLTEEEIINNYASCEVLVLDDLGAEKESEFVIVTLYLIIDRRNRYGRKTIITTNLSLPEIEEKLGARIASRLSEMKIIKINMPDYRKRRAQ